MGLCFSRQCTIGQTFIVLYIKMADGNKEDLEDRDRGNKGKGRCGKHKRENKRG